MSWPRCKREKEISAGKLVEQYECGPCYTGIFICDEQAAEVLCSAIRRRS